MTESEFAELLEKYDSIFLPKRRGSSGNFWIVEGMLIGGASIRDLKGAMSSEKYSIDIRDFGKTIQITVEERDNVVLKIPSIPRIHIVLFFATILTTLMAGAIMEGVNIYLNPSKSNLFFNIYSWLLIL